MLKVLCCGGRKYSEYAYVCQRLDELRLLMGDFVVIHGGAKGADSLCALWAASKGLPVITVYLNWHIYKNGAGAVRNSWMLEFCAPNYAVAFPGGTGTADMVAKLNSKRITVWDLRG